MNLSTTTSGLHERFGIKSAVSMIAKAGFDGIDFFAQNEEFCTEVHNRDYYRELRMLAEDLGVRFNQAHAPFPSSFPDVSATQERFRRITVSMRNAAWLGVKDIIVHPCKHLEYDDAGIPEKLFDYNMDFYRRLTPYCEEYGIRVAVENLGRYENGIRHAPCSRPAEFVRYLDGLDRRWFVGCIDLGHSRLVGEPPENTIRALGGDRLKCLHVQDMRECEDSHTLPYYGIIDWDAVTRALADIGYDGDFTYEASSFFRRVPPELIQDALNYMEKVGRHLIRKIEQARK